MEQISNNSKNATVKSAEIEKGFVKQKQRKKLKPTDIIIVVVLCVVVLVIFASSFDLSSLLNTSSGAINNFEVYVLTLENKVADIVGAIDGVGKADVAITFESGVEKIYAYETTTTSTGDTKNDLMLYQGEPIVVKEITPKILGVVVVAKGAGSAVVRLNIVRTVQVLLGVSYDKIEVFIKN